MEKHVAPFARTAFALPAKNPSVQFQNFLSLVEWLALEATGDRGAFSVDKFDDPNTCVVSIAWREGGFACGEPRIVPFVNRRDKLTHPALPPSPPPRSAVNKMMLCLRNLGFSLDFPVAKLKTGFGVAICNVLDFLADAALARRGFSWATPQHEEPAEVEEAEVDEDADLGGEVVDEAEAVVEDEGVFDSAGAGSAEESFTGADAEAHALIANTIDPLVWKTELERVGPRLKAAAAGGLGKEWRAHIEQTKAHEQTIQAVLPGAQGHMKAIAAQVAEAVEKMRSKEMGLNSQFDHIRAEYEELHGSLKAAQAKQGATQASVGSLTNAMASIQEQLDELKEDMEGRENSATDTSPLVNIKQALVSIRGDVQQFDLRIGVVSHTLMQAKLKVAKSRDSQGARAAKERDAKEAEDTDLDDDAY